MVARAERHYWLRGAAQKLGKSVKRRYWAALSLSFCQIFIFIYYVNEHNSLGSPGKGSAGNKRRGRAFGLAWQLTTYNSKVLNFAFLP